MKILMVQKIEGIAGAEKYWLEIMPALLKSKINIHFLGIYNQEKEQNVKEIYKILTEQGIKTHRIPIKKRFSFSMFKELNVLVQNEKYDIIHTHLISADFYLALYKLFFNNKIILVSTKHGYEEAYNNANGFDPSKRIFNLYWFTAKFAEQLVNKSYTISRGLQNLYVGLGICDEKKLDLIYYGFDFEDKNLTNDKCRFARKQLIIVGRLTAFKGHRFAFESIKIVSQEHPDVKLIVVGSGELEKGLKQMVVDLQIENNIMFTGFKTNAREFMYNSDIILLPSISEGFGVVLLEAFSVKKPIIAFDVPSPSELIKNRVSGILIPPYNIHKFAEAINELLANSALRKKIADNANQNLINYFNKNRMLQETITFYNNVIS